MGTVVSQWGGRGRAGGEWQGAGRGRAGGEWQGRGGVELEGVAEAERSTEGSTHPGCRPLSLPCCPPAQSPPEWSAERTRICSPGCSGYRMLIAAGPLENRVQCKGTTAAVRPTSE